MPPRSDLCRPVEYRAFVPTVMSDDMAEFVSKREEHTRQETWRDEDEAVAPGDDRRSFVAGEAQSADDCTGQIGEDLRQIECWVVLTPIHEEVAEAVRQPVRFDEGLLRWSSSRCSHSGGLRRAGSTLSAASTKPAT